MRFGSKLGLHGSPGYCETSDCPQDTAYNALSTPGCHAPDGQEADQSLDVGLGRNSVSDLLLKARILEGNTREIPILALKWEAGQIIPNLNQVTPFTYMT